MMFRLQTRRPVCRPHRRHRPSVLVTGLLVCGESRLPSGRFRAFGSADSDFISSALELEMVLLDLWLGKEIRDCL